MTDFDHLGDAEFERIHEICNRFEAVWRHERQGIERFLATMFLDGIPQIGERQSLLHELIRVELELRQESCEHPSPDSYRVRFPNESDFIGTVFGSGNSSSMLPSRNAGEVSDIGRYQLQEEKEIGKGGLGIVFKVLDRDLDRTVAVKEILPRHADDPDSRQRFERELHITSKLEHPGIVPVYGRGSYPDGRPFYAMRLIKGHTLEEIVRRYREDHKRRSEGQRSHDFLKLLRHFLNACDAISYAHSRNILHRDIKPANIMVGPFGETVVMDWGLAKDTAFSTGAEKSDDAITSDEQHDVASDTSFGKMIGTPGYASPEQFQSDAQRPSIRSDIYGLGATLYYVLTGVRPEAKPATESDSTASQDRSIVPPRKQDSTIHPALEAICLKSLAHKQEDRYESVRALASDIERWIADEATVALPEGRLSRLQRWLRKRPGIRVGLSFTIVVTTTITLGFLVVSNRVERTARDRIQRRERLAISSIASYHDVVLQNLDIQAHPELVELRKQLLSRPLAFYASLVELMISDGQTSNEARLALANAQANYAEILSEIGAENDCIDAYRRLLTTLDSFPNGGNFRNDLLLDRVGCYIDLGSVLSKSTESTTREEADRCFQEAARLLEDRVKAVPTDRQAVARLAKVYGLIGDQLQAKADRRDDALKYYFTARERWEGLVTLPSVTPQDRAGLAACLTDIWGMFEETSQNNLAIIYLDQARVILERLVFENPDIDQFKEDLASVLTNKSRYLHKYGTATEMAECAKDSVRVFRTLLERRPANKRIASSLASAISNFGIAQMRQGEMEQARDAFAESIQRKRNLMFENPSNQEYIESLAADLLNQSVVFHSSEDGERERMALGEAIALRKTLLELNGGENGLAAEKMIKLASVYCNYGACLTDSAKYEEAKESLNSAIQLGRRAIVLAPAHLDYQRELAGSIVNLGRILRLERRFRESINTLKNGELIQRRVIELEPKNQTDQCLYAEIQYELGLAYEREHLMPRSQEAISKAVEHQQRAYELGKDDDMQKRLEEYRENLLRLMDMAFPKNPFQK